MSRSSTSLSFKVGNRRVRPDRNLLAGPDGDVTIQPRVMDVLLALTRHAGETVARDDLLSEVWGDTAVTEEVLTNAIFELRRALGDEAKAPRFIETVARKGYRLVAPVTRPETVSPDRPPTAPDPPPAAAPRRHRTSPRISRQVLWIVVTVVALAGLSAWWMDRAAAPKSPRIASLAVLPLDNLSGDPAERYFVDGMTEELTNRLAGIGALRVISRRSVERYRDSAVPLPSIARELGIDAVVEGSVLRSADEVRITARLVAVEGERALWSGSYRAAMRDVLALQADVAREIAEEIELRLTPEERARLEIRRPVDPEAHRQVLLGRHLCAQRTEEALDRAIEHFQRAVDLDPTHAYAHAGLAEAHNLLANYGFRPAGEARPAARSAALAALALDESLADAHVALAAVRQEYDWHFDLAEGSYRRALELSPSHAKAHHWFGVDLAAHGRFAEAEHHLEEARRLDPLSAITAANAGWVLYFQRRWDEAAVLEHEALALDPHFAVAHYYLGLIDLARDRPSDALLAFERARELSGGSDYTRTAAAVAEARLGDPRPLRKVLQAMTARAEHEYVSPVSLVTLYLGLDDKDAVFVWLERAFEERKGWLINLRVEPLLDPVRDDPRFEALALRIGIPPLVDDPARPSPS